MPGRPPLIPRLILEPPMSYCCEWAFFKRNRRSGLIAERLGVSKRAVQLHLARFRAGEMECQGCDRCLKPLLTGR